jgi:glutathione S-transferase
MPTTEVVKLYGAAWSVYVRIVRLALEEKQVKYDLVEVDVFAETGVPQEHLKRHPFGRIPAFEHGAGRAVRAADVQRSMGTGRRRAARRTRALERYRSQDWDAAAALLDALIAQDPQCALYRVYHERIMALRESRRATDWDGITTFDTK